MTAFSAPPQEKKPAHMSRSEKLFNWMAYGGFAGAATFALGLPVGYWARYTPSGRQTIHLTAHALEKMGLSAHAAEDVVMTTALMQGGNIMTFGVKRAEDEKKKIISGIGRAIGEEVDLSAIEKEPRQTASSMLKARFLAWGAVFGALRGSAHFAGKERFDRFEEAFSRNLVCRPLGCPTHINGVETRLFKLGRIGAIDSFATASAAVLLYAGSRMFGEKAPEKEPVTLAMTPNPRISVKDLEHSENRRIPA